MYTTSMYISQLPRLFEPLCEVRLYDRSVNHDLLVTTPQALNHLHEVEMVLKSPNAQDTVSASTVPHGFNCQCSYTRVHSAQGSSVLIFEKEHLLRIYFTLLLF